MRPIRTTADVCQLQTGTQLVQVTQQPTYTPQVMIVANKLSYSSRYSSGSAVCLGTLQVVLSVLIIGLQSLSFPLYSEVTSHVGQGFWCGLPMFICGILAISSAKKPSICIVVWLSLLSTLTAILMVPYLTLNAVSVSRERHNLYYNYSSRNRTQIILSLIFGAVGIILAIIGAILCLWSAVIPCLAACKTSDDGTKQMYNVQNIRNVDGTTQTILTPAVNEVVLMPNSLPVVQSTQVQEQLGSRQDQFIMMQSASNATNQNRQNNESRIRLPRSPPPYASQECREASGTSHTYDNLGATALPINENSDPIQSKA